MVKDLIKYVMGIVLAVFVVLISIPIWQNSFSSSNMALLNEYKDNDIMIDYEDLNLMILNKKDIDQLEKNTIMLRNPNNYEKVGTLYFVVSSDTTFDTSYLNIQVNGISYNLSELESKLNNEDKFYKIKDLAIKSYEEEKVTYSLWIDDSIPDIKENDTLTIDFRFL